MTATLGALLHDGRIDEAKAEAARRLDGDGRDAEALAAMAKIALIEGDGAIAETFLLRAEKRGITADTLLVRAAFAAEAGDGALALELYRSVLELEPRAEAWFGRGRVYAASGALVEARHAFERALALDPSSAAFHFQLGTILARLGELEAAAASFQATIERCAYYLPVYPALAGILAEMGHPEEATVVIDVGLELAPEHPSLLAAKCELLMRTNDLEGALETAERARAAAPKDAAAIARSVAIHIALNAPDRALAIIDAARAVARRNAALCALEGIARASLPERDVEGAARAYRRAMALDPRDWRSANDLGVLALERGSVEDALGLLEEARRRGPGELEVVANLAHACALSGDVLAAERWASRVLASGLDPDHPVRTRAKAVVKSLVAPPRRVRREARVVEHDAGDRRRPSR